MMNRQKILLSALFLIVAVGMVIVPAVSASDINVYFFWGEGCPHCNKEKLFLDALKKTYPELRVKSYEVWFNKENAGLFVSLLQAYGKRAEGVPTTIIGDFEPIVGYLNDEVTGKDIEDKVRKCRELGCKDPIEKIWPPTERREDSVKEKVGKTIEKPAVADKAPEIQPESIQKVPEKKQPSPPVKTETLSDQVKEEKVSAEAKTAPVEEPSIVTLPFIGAFDTSKTSLPLLTIIIAGLDGFNPCAFFVLLLLLSILVYARSRKIMLLIGGIFVFFSGFIYFLFMAAWLNVFLLFGQLKVITIVAGAVAIGISLINIKDFFFFKKGISLSIPEKAKPRLYERTRNLLKGGSLVSMILGTIALAIAANSYELLCTAGFPLIYTRALTLHHLTQVQYYLYLLFYNMIYVVPLFVIVIAFSITLGAKKLTEWQGRVLKLISGLMMFWLGLLLLIKPDLLNNVVVSAGLLVASIVSALIIIVITKAVESKGLKKE